MHRRRRCCCFFSFARSIFMSTCLRFCIILIKNTVLNWLLMMKRGLSFNGMLFPFVLSACDLRSLGNIFFHSLGRQVGKMVKSRQFPSARSVKGEFCMNFPLISRRTVFLVVFRLTNLHLILDPPSVFHHSATSRRWSWFDKNVWKKDFFLFVGGKKFGRSGKYLHEYTYFEWAHSCYVVI